MALPNTSSQVPSSSPQHLTKQMPANALTIPTPSPKPWRFANNPHNIYNNNNVLSKNALGVSNAI
jgi:hypothetical protein